jgi:hypothetical protein
MVFIAPPEDVDRGQRQDPLPSMFLTLTLGPYGKVCEDGMPADPE